MPQPLSQLLPEDQLPPEDQLAPEDQAPRGLSHRRFASPVGELTLTAGERGLIGITWPVERAGRVRLLDSATTGVAEIATAATAAVLDETARQLSAYFAGTLQRFDLPLNLRGTPFQLRVWAALQQLSFGQTCSYGELAERVGGPLLTRAVGAANGRNPISIVVPCHRVIGSDGALTGFAGGLAAKRFLLQHEGCCLPVQQQPGLFD